MVQLRDIIILTRNWIYGAAWSANTFTRTIRIVLAMGVAALQGLLAGARTRWPAADYAPDPRHIALTERDGRQIGFALRAHGLSSHGRPPICCMANRWVVAACVQSWHDTVRPCRASRRSCRDMIEKLQRCLAKGRGARMIVLSCGFDAIPFDRASIFCNKSARNAWRRRFGCKACAR